MTAALPMGAQKITGMADPTLATDGATKNYVDTTTASFFGTGDVKPTFKIAADTGWLLMDDGTFGNASSGSSNSNNIANLALFTLFFNAPFTDANVPIFTSGGGATTRVAQVSASAAWAANCRMSLPKAMGRAFGAAGAGSGLTTRLLGAFVGLEAFTLTQTNLPSVNLTTNITDPGHFHDTVIGSFGGAPGGISFLASSGGTATHQFSNPSATNITASTPLGGSNTAFSIMQPSLFVNWMVKL